jgi:polyhydroxyalkanoate synthase subunit PhaC
MATPVDTVNEVGQAAASAVLGANPFVRLDRTEILAATANLVGRVLFRGGLRRDIAGELVRIARGVSDVSPDRGDRRFTDTTWTENPACKRWMQAYLLAERALKRLPDDVGMEGRDADKARFITTMVAEAVAPTNVLAGNPAALKRALETGGLSLVAGLRSFLNDVRTNGGMPSQVDSTPFRLGETLAVTPGSVVYRSDVLELIQYAPATADVRQRPLVVLPPQINKFYVLDLAPGRSMIEYIVAHGQQVFVVSWRNPGREHADWDLTRYVLEAEQAIEAAQRITGADRVNLLGACAGGITTAALLGHLTATGRDLIESVTLLVTVLDTDAPSAASLFASDRAVAAAIRRSRRRGVLEGRDLARAFAWLRPNDLVWNYWVNNYLMGNKPPAFDVLAWNADSTNLPAELHADFLTIFATNALAHPDMLKIDETPIDLAKVGVDSYVVGALTDHITPWKACYRTPFLLGGNAEFVLSSSGHIQALVNPPGNPKARYHVNPALPDDPDRWLAAAETRTGSWWEHWLGWLAERSGDERQAPGTVGSAAYPTLESAPGSYVRQ